MRLDPRFRFALYAAFLVLLVTGAAWLIADQMKDEPYAGEAWQTAAAYLIMAHGGGAMISLILLGALVPVHAQRCWRGRRNRLMGAIMLICNGVLVFTSFGLYYAGSEILRPYLSTIHTDLGLALPAVWVVHVIMGRIAPGRFPTKIKD